MESVRRIVTRSLSSDGVPGSKSATRKGGRSPRRAKSARSKIIVPITEKDNRIFCNDMYTVDFVRDSLDAVAKDSTVDCIILEDLIERNHRGITKAVHELFVNTTQSAKLKNSPEDGEDNEIGSRRPPERRGSSGSLGSLLAISGNQNGPGTLKRRGSSGSLGNLLAISGNQNDPGALKRRGSSGSLGNLLASSSNQNGSRTHKRRGSSGSLGSLLAGHKTQEEHPQRRVWKSIVFLDCISDSESYDAYLNRKRGFVTALTRFLKAKGFQDDLPIRFEARIEIHPLLEAAAILQLLHRIQQDSTVTRVEFEGALSHTDHVPEEFGKLIDPESLTVTEMVMIQLYYDKQTLNVDKEVEAEGKRKVKRVSQLNTKMLTTIQQCCWILDCKLNPQNGKHDGDSLTENSDIDSSEGSFDLVGSTGSEEKSSSMGPKDENKEGRVGLDKPHVDSPYPSPKKKGPPVQLNLTLGGSFWERGLDKNLLLALLVDHEAATDARRVIREPSKTIELAPLESPSDNQESGRNTSSRSQSSDKGSSSAASAPWPAIDPEEKAGSSSMSNIFQNEPKQKDQKAVPTRSSSMSNILQDESKRKHRKTPRARRRVESRTTAAGDGNSQSPIRRVRRATSPTPVTRAAVSLSPISRVASDSKRRVHRSGLSRKGDPEFDWSSGRSRSRSRGRDPEFDWSSHSHCLRTSQSGRSREGEQPEFDWDSFSQKV